MSEQKLVIMEVLNGLGQLNAFLKNMMTATGIDDPNEMIRSVNNHEWKHTRIAEAVKKVLKEIRDVTVELNRNIKPSEVLVTQEGKLWIDPDLKKIFDLANADNGEVPTSVSLKENQLIENAKDKSIRDELPAEFKAGPKMALQLLATEMGKVINGKKSEILSKDSWVLLYVAGFVVHAGWGSGGRRWNVRVWESGDYAWNAGDRVLSCN